MSKSQRAFVVLNPKAGHSDSAAARRAIEGHFGDAGWTYRVYEIGDQQPVAEAVRAALADGVEIVVAMGGDGTVSAVADELMHSEALLGIVPVGTGNTLAQDLGIPVDLERSLGLVVGPHAVEVIDAMRVGDRYAVLNVGIGLSALMMRDTGHRVKRWLGLAAYVQTGLTKLAGFQPHRFTLVIDGEHSYWRASEVTVANSGAIGKPAFRWGPQIRLNDGRLDVCVVRARHALDYVRLAWNIVLRRQRRDPDLRCETVQESVTIRSDAPLAVQVDGEIVGETPVHVRAVPDALRVIVPRSRDVHRERQKSE